MEGCGWCKKFLPEWEEIKQKIDSRELKGLKHYEFKSSELKENKRAIKIQQHVKVDGFPTIVVKIGDNYFKYEGDRTMFNILDFITNKMKENIKLEADIINNLQEIIAKNKKENSSIKQLGGKRLNYKKKYHKYKELYFESLKK